MDKSRHPQVIRTWKSHQPQTSKSRTPPRINKRQEHTKKPAAPKGS